MQTVAVSVLLWHSCCTVWKMVLGIGARAPHDHVCDPCIGIAATCVWHSAIRPYTATRARPRARWAYADTNRLAICVASPCLQRRRPRPCSTWWSPARASQGSSRLGSTAGSEWAVRQVVSCVAFQRETPAGHRQWAFTGQLSQSRTWTYGRQ